MESGVFGVVTVEGLALVAAVAAARAHIAGLGRRVGKLERAHEGLGKDFVPRRELAASLENIRETTTRTHGLVRALIQAGGARGVDVRGLDIRAIEAAADTAAAGVNHLAYGPRGLALTKSFEGLCLHAYQDSAGIWTVGYGHTAPDVGHGTCVTPAQAELLLHADLAAAVACVNHAVTVALTQNQFDALVDFTYNEGRASLLRSGLLRDLNAGDFDSAARQFGEWVCVDSRPVAGLVRRRAAEAALFREAA